MQRLEVSDAVRPIYVSLGVKGLTHQLMHIHKIFTLKHFLGAILYILM